MTDDARRLAQLVKELAGTMEAEENGNDTRPRTANKVLREAYKLAQQILTGKTS